MSKDKKINMGSLLSSPKKPASLFPNEIKTLVQQSGTQDTCYDKCKMVIAGYPPSGQFTQLATLCVPVSKTSSDIIKFLIDKNLLKNNMSGASVYRPYSNVDTTTIDNKNATFEVFKVTIDLDTAYLKTKATNNQTVYAVVLKDPRTSTENPFKPPLQADISNILPTTTVAKSSSPRQQSSKNKKSNITYTNQKQINYCHTHASNCSGGQVKRQFKSAFEAHMAGITG